MPLVFTKDEIGDYLNEMGFGELSHEDLDRFIKDLKRLIKAESKKRRRRRLGHTGHTRSDISSFDSETQSNIMDTDISSTSDRARTDNGTTPSNVRETVERSEVIKERQKQSKQYHERESSENSGPSNPRTSTSGSSGSNQKSSATMSGDSYSTRGSDQPDRSGVIMRSNRHQRILHPSNRTNRGQSDQESASGSCSDALSDTDLLNLMEQILKTEVGDSETASGDIDNKKRLEIPYKIRRDPVALYHWYKSFWDKQKPPGEDRHLQLRWNVRAGTIGKVPCDADGRPINYLSVPKRATKSAFGRVAC